jgi:hypothetical protein
MPEYLDKILRGENPFVAWEANEIDADIDSLYELKFGVVFYTDSPPGPKRARSIFDLYMARYESSVRRYISTSPGEDLQDWVTGTKRLFHNSLLPRLRQTTHWGYGFDDGNELDSYLFMFHGYRPVTQKGKASFFRFEFPWNIDQAQVRQLAIDVAMLVPFVNGFGGYFFKPAIEVPESYDKMYAICRRFWGIEAWNLDVTASYVLDGYKSVNWLTFIGDALGKREPKALKRAKQGAFDFCETPYGAVLQASETALLGDRNRMEEMPGYFDIAQALLPLQIKTYGSFGGERWDEENSLNWIRRFTHPDSV